jgi:hypothetical protein
MALLSAVAMAAPVGLGLLAGWATYRGFGHKRASE